MRWYREGSHFTQATGNLVLDRILVTPGAQDPKGFGIRLDRDNVEQVLAAVREGRRHWLDGHGAAAAEIAAIAARYPQNRQPEDGNR
jgi:hypothetical protein